MKEIVKNRQFWRTLMTLVIPIVSVPLSFFCAFVLKLPPMWVYFVICMDEFWKIPFVLRYYRSYDWIRNITR